MATHSNTSRLILAGDIGGTKTLLQVAEVIDHKVHVLSEQRFESAKFSGLVPIVEMFLGTCSDMGIQLTSIKTACFGVAGPINGRQASLTNLPWTIDADEIMHFFGFSNVSLVNDFEAIGYGIAALQPDDMTVLQQGAPKPQGMQVVLGAGTGLGVCFLVWCGGRYQVIPSEGGHMDFAPVDEQQIQLLHYLRQTLGHVSYERLVSGAGLIAIYQFLCEQSATNASLELRQAMLAGDAAAVIAEFALTGKDEVAKNALDMFVRIYGAQAGNLALAVLARGGVYVAGGIAPKIISTLLAGGFMQAFLDKGRFRGMLSDLPVQVIMNEKVGLLGAALLASRLV